jgi:hypothetical protein
MSTSLDNERINQLINEKKYEEAKSILRQSGDPAAQKWLARLEELFPREISVAPARPDLPYGSYGLEQPQRYGQPSRSTYTPTQYAPYERGGCLSAWLVVIGGINAIFVVLSLVGFNLLQIILSGFVLACIVGIWNQQKWGFWGLIAAYILNIAIGLFLAQNVAIAIGGVIGLTITYALVNPQLEHFS